MSGYASFLSPEERLESIRFGFATKLAELGLRPSDLDSEEKLAEAGFEKRALGGDKFFDLNSVLTAAIAAGIPLGAVAFAVSRSVNAKDKEEQALEKEREYYKALVEKEKNRLPVVKSRPSRSYFG